MYRDNLMDHYKNPRHQGTLDNFSVEHTEKNLSCGDEITIQVLIDENKIEEIAFHGQGCAISLASTSMLLEHIEGTTVDEAMKMSKDDMLELVGVQLKTMRVKCALLGLHTLKKALIKHYGEENDAGNK